MNALLADTDAGFDAFVEFVEKHFAEDSSGGRFVRDVFGRLHFVAPPGIAEEDVEQAVASIPSDLRGHLAPRSPILTANNPLAGPLLVELGQRVSGPLGVPYILLDRRLAGEAWLSAPRVEQPAVPRIAFYGLKGGVGRSTALAVAAADLASLGASVLVLDLDLEAPGLESILLRPDRVPNYGVLDWLAAATAGLNASELVPEMIGGSPFTTGAGLVDVVPVTGAKAASRPETFLSKLARAYTPGAPSGQFSQKTFSDKIEILIEQLCERRRYDAILIDVRAGLHETSATSLLGLGATVLLFGTDTAHTFSGYSILLATIRQTMESWTEVPELRDRFRMVHGRARSATSAGTSYLSKSWQMWLDHLYDAVDDDLDLNTFSFDVDDASGPHYPITIQSSDAFVEFNPNENADTLTTEVYFGPYRQLINYIRNTIKLRDI